MKPFENGSDLKVTQTPGSQVVRTGQASWRLEIPPGPAGRYRLAQLDDYHARRRSAFRWHALSRLSLQARASAAVIPGTWGFGLWNDPFSMSLLGGEGWLRVPTWPDAAWFFFAAPPNHLSLRDDLPAQGWLAQTFRSPTHPLAWRALSLPALPLLVFPPLARRLRGWWRGAVSQEAIALPLDPTEWHTYSQEWQADQVTFSVNGQVTWSTSLVPRGPLGLVIWVDNQFAAFPPHGSPRWGTLSNPGPAWIEIRDLSILPG